MCPAKMQILQMNNHFQSIKETLVTLLQSDTLTDMALITTNHTFPVHRFMLSTFSTYFSKLLENRNRAQNSYHNFVLSGVNKIVVEKVLKIVYDGSVHICDSIANDFVHACEMFKLQLLQTAITDVFGDNVKLFTLSQHKEILLNNLWLSRTPLQSDVTFVTKELSLCNVHSIVISAHSKYMLNIFSKRKVMQKPLIFVLQNVEEKHLQCVIEYCYKGSVLVLQDSVKDIYDIATVLGIETLCEAILNVDPTLKTENNKRSAGIVSLIKSPHSQKQNMPTCRNNVLSAVMESEHLVDYTVITGNCSHNVHLAVLSEFSPYFRNLAKTFVDIKDSCILIKDLNSFHVQCFVDYLYRGETEYFGSIEEFLSAFNSWIDFDLLSIFESKECQILSSNETPLPPLVNNICNNIAAVGCQSTIEAQALKHTSLNEHMKLELLPVKEGELNQEGENVEDVDATGVDATNNDEEDTAGDPYEDDDAKEELKLKSSTRKFSTSVCHTCGQEFKTLKLFRKHLVIHPNGKTMKCQYCDKTFNKSSQLQLHVRTHTGARPYQCTQCGSAFAAKSSLNKHVSTHSSDSANKYECDACSKVFTRKDYLEEHIRAHSGNKPYKCTTCHKSFVGRTGLNHHTKTHEGSRHKSAVCEVCGKSFTRHSLWTHMKSHIKTHDCEVCHKLCSTKTALNIHMASVHLGHRSHQCDVCGKAFVQKNHLIRHMRIHRDIAVKEKKIYACDKCPEGFSTETKLRSHVAREHVEGGDRPYPCNVCGRKFAGRSTVIYHQRTHTGELPHVCATCGKKFARPDTLQQHSRVHTNQRERTRKAEPHVNKCLVCNVTCSSKRALKKHLDSHAKESKHLGSKLTKSYDCSVCSKSFNSETLLLTHAQDHDLNKFHCEICDKSFAYEQSLMKHLHTHTTPPSVPTDLPPIYSFQDCEPVYSHSFSNTIPYIQNENHIANDSQYDPRVVDESQPSYSAGKQTESLRRPYSINIDGNLCCNNDEDKLISLPPDHMVSPTMLREDIELHQMQQTIPITSIDINAEPTPLTMLAVAMSDMIAAAQSSGNYVITNN